MKLSISNIGWTAEQDEDVYAKMRDYGFTGLEIAPTRIFPERPYEHLREAAAWSRTMASDRGFTIPSMQSIWFGRQESLFGTQEERKALADYTKAAIDFAEAIGCRNLVFGCPRNRNLPENRRAELAYEGEPAAGRNREGDFPERRLTERRFPDEAVLFFREVGDYAAEKGTVIGMEANPPIYNTNFINRTKEALALIQEVNSPGFLLNLDVGTMVQNGEEISVLRGEVSKINHVHISEPGLKPIQERALHRELRDLLRAERYQNFISIEMGRTENPEELLRCMEYVSGVFRE